MAVAPGNERIWLGRPRAMSIRGSFWSGPAEDLRLQDLRLHEGIAAAYRWFPRGAA
ncbi:MAG: hypothetical protein JF593_10575 [Novosphingobium sp.]|nr:hypothetical protein [Novosphingobium sp.]